MTKVNIIFDDVLDDVDIIQVPNNIIPQIENLGQSFLNWISTTNDNDYFYFKESKKYLIAETKGFVKWLNTFYCIGKEKAFIYSQHSNYISEYKSINF